MQSETLVKSLMIEICILKAQKIPRDSWSVRNGFPPLRLLGLDLSILIAAQEFAG